MHSTVSKTPCYVRAGHCTALQLRNRERRSRDVVSIFECCNSTGVCSNVLAVAESDSCQKQGRPESNANPAELQERLSWTSEDTRQANGFATSSFASAKVNHI